MLHVIIDLLERLSNWMKSFVNKKNEFTIDKDVEIQIQRPATKPTHEQVKNTFEYLCQKNNSNPKEIGAITDRETDEFVVGDENAGKEANAKVWNAMFPYCGRWYDVRTVDNKAGV